MNEKKEDNQIVTFKKNYTCFLDSPDPEIMNSGKPASPEHNPA